MVLKLELVSDSSSSVLLTFSKSSSPLQWCLRFRHEHAKKWRFFPDPILGKSWAWMKERRVLTLIVLLESIVYCLWEFFSQSFWEEYCEHSGKRGHHPHDKHRSWKPVNLDINRDDQISYLMFAWIDESFKRFLVAPIHSDLLRLIVNKRQRKRSTFKFKYCRVL